MGRNNEGSERNNQLKAQMSERESSTIRLSKFIIASCLQVSQFDLFPSEEDGSKGKRWWAKFASAFHWYSTCRAIVYCSCHYKYDIHLFQLKRLTAIARDANSTIEPELARLRSLVEEDTRVLKTIGAPFMHLNFGVELAYIYMFYVYFITLLLPQIYTRLGGKFNFTSLRLIVDYEQGQEKYASLIRNELDRLKLSARNFVDRKQAGIVCSNLKPQKLIPRQAETEILLEFMLEAGIFEPINRNSDRREIMAKIYCRVFCSLFVAATSTVIGIIILLCKSELTNFQTGSVDMVNFTENTIMIVVGIFCATFWLTLLAIGSLDILYLLNGLLARIGHCHRLSEATLSVGRPGRKAHLPDLVTEMNANLLAVLVHFRMFTHEVRAFKESSKILAFGTLQLTFLVPVLVRAHALYLDKSLIAPVLSFSLLFLALGDLCLVPICHKHSRFFDLYKSLASLLARTIEFDRATAGEIYDPHTIWLLRKELSRPEDLMDLLSTRVLGFLFNYQNLLRAHFWAGVLVLSTALTLHAS